MAGSDGARLDSALVERGLARSRTLAARLIADGLVTLDGRPVVKASTRVPEHAELAVTASDGWVSRGAHKLIAAFDRFGIDPAGRLALDAGASTGGFTQVLLSRGARKVLAIDVGHGQLAGEVALDERVASFEGVNVRELDAGRLAGLSGSAERPSLVVADLSFISLRLVFGPLISCATPAADYVLLIKPQFEVGRTGIREGIVRDAGLRADAIVDVLWAAWDAGLGTADLMSSPITGSAGNREYLVHLRAARDVPASESNDQSEWGSPSLWEGRIPSIAGA